MKAEITDWVAAQKQEEVGPQRRNIESRSEEREGVPQGGTECSGTDFSADRSYRCRGRAKAFTVLEVLISLAILAMTAVVLGAAYLNVLTSYEHATRDTQADEDQRFALSQLLAQSDLKKAEEGAEFDSIGNRHIRWKAQIDPTNLPDLFDVSFSCEINDPGKGGPKTEVQTLRLLRPTWSVPADRDKLRQDIAKQIQQGNPANK